MEISVEQLFAKIGQLTMLLEGAQARIAELEAELATIVSKSDSQ